MVSFTSKPSVPAPLSTLARTEASDPSDCSSDCAAEPNALALPSNSVNALASAGPGDAPSTDSALRLNAAAARCNSWNAPRNSCALAGSTAAVACTSRTACGESSESTLPNSRRAWSPSTPSVAVSSGTGAP